MEKYICTCIGGRGWRGVGVQGRAQKHSNMLWLKEGTFTGHLFEAVACVSVSAVSRRKIFRLIKFCNNENFPIYAGTSYVVME